jgi:hypothetical protein
MKHIFKQVKSAAVENLDQSQRDGLVRFEVNCRTWLRADCLCFRCHVCLLENWTS